MKKGNGREPTPDRVLMVGVPGVGKSTWAGDAQGPVLFVRSEENRLPQDYVDPESWLEFVEVFDRHQDHIPEGTRTVVIDLVDGFDEMAQDHVLRERFRGDRERFADYGKGAAEVHMEWRRAIGLVENVRRFRGINVIMLCHAKVKSFRDPSGPDFDRYEPVLASKDTGAYLKGYADSVLFAVFQQNVRKGKAQAAGQSRVIHTQWSPAWDAKNRYGLPPRLPMSFEDYAAARDKGLGTPIEELTEKAVRLLADLDGHPKHELMSTTVDGFIESSNVTGLLKAIDRMNAALTQDAMAAGEESAA